MNKGCKINLILNTNQYEQLHTVELQGSIHPGCHWARATDKTTPFNWDRWVSAGFGGDYQAGGWLCLEIRSSARGKWRSWSLYPLKVGNHSSWSWSLMTRRAEDEHKMPLQPPQRMPALRG